jgi:hypothetical protein
VRKAFAHAPLFALENDDTGFVKIPRKKEQFCPKFLRSDFDRYFFAEPKPRFSPFVIKALVDVITGGAGNDPTPPIGVYRSGPMIEQFFVDCGLDMPIGATSRVPATTEFLRQVARGEDGDAALTRILLRVADPRD